MKPPCSYFEDKLKLGKMQRKTKNTDYSETKREAKEEAKNVATLKIINLQMEGKRQVKLKRNGRDKGIKRTFGTGV